MANLPNISTPEQIHALLLEPAGKPPAGEALNLQNPSNLDVPVFLTMVFCGTIAALTTLMRIYTKFFLIKSLAYEDCKR